MAKFLLTLQFIVPGEDVDEVTPASQHHRPVTAYAADVKGVWLRGVGPQVLSRSGDLKFPFV